MGTISKNFSFREFEESATAHQAGIVNVITTTEVRDAITELVQTVLQPLRDAWGAPLRVNSGYRCKELNTYINGAASSQHMKGEAADIHAADPYKLAAKVRELGLPFDQLILYPTFCHISHKKGGPQRGRTLYAKNYTGKRF